MSFAHTQGGLILHRKVGVGRDQTQRRVGALDYRIFIWQLFVAASRLGMPSHLHIATNRYSRFKRQEMLCTLTVLPFDCLISCGKLGIENI